MIETTISDWLEDLDISTGPSNDRAWFFMDCGTERDDAEREYATTSQNLMTVKNIVFSVNHIFTPPFPELGSGSGAYNRAENLLWDSWCNAFHDYINRQQEKMGDDIEISWRKEPALETHQEKRQDGEGNQLMLKIYSRFGLYKKQGLEWEFRAYPGTTQDEKEDYPEGIRILVPVIKQDE